MEKVSLEDKSNNFELKYAKLAPRVIEALQDLPRTGWVNRGVSRPETVQEHIVSLRELVISNFDSLNDFSPAEKEEILDMLEVHDWPESDSNVGDIVILTKDAEERKILKDKKFQLELEAMNKICKPLGSDGDRIFALWMRFEKGADLPSQFARQLDKYQAIEKAFEYEQSNEPVSTQEFIENAEKGIIHPFLLKKLQAIKLKLDESK